MSLITPSQTIGPFPHEAWRWAFDPGTAGTLRISCRVFDGDGVPVGDALLEAWVPAAAGVIDGLPGLHRVPADDAGAFTLALPSRPAPGQPAAHVTVFARGLLVHLFTAVFLADDPGLADAPLLQQVDAARRDTMLARTTADGYRWDVHLQGPHETVFFDYA